MFEALKGLNFTDPGFLIPLVVVAVVLLIVVSVAKKLIKLAIFICIAILAITVYLNMPSFKIEDSKAVLKIQGNEYTLDAKDIKIESEKQGDSDKVFLVSGSTRIELPFSKEFAEKFIMDKLKERR
ncbi:hypothetical protein CDQ84_01430 [Clostridium thermosuccinogenes]|jgi:hypothetical protein|uniref:Uncharacterized protein n=1 Tax=Clostridium thermosuccinogenes TaxID=84032 RepID=A0A2K2F442_9CLOT|nr:hypothetical protein [Pseudoclostridium thermosuccinogenes]AUS95730.1 hypothetical protein CDO33_04305 [Pseudoclostridium thermosuccinogenes]PNT93548.1 hypothetical protein CDQ83_08630 [Pseudoclostridium thermosuccinogenes]PNT99910.1 hypothetical protein CDQ85_01430 [Pseudoclostridium thermosuccinogenes]PNU01355.1 hypothetical protein CDQ84_01430 [Pseudoclostridium thermosuccinogenes]